jgi:hypothetical protein
VDAYGSAGASYRNPAATNWNPSGPIQNRWCDLLEPQRTHMDLLVQPTGNPADPYACPGATFRGRPTEQTAADVYQSGTSGAGGTTFSLGGTQRTHIHLLVQPAGAQRTHMGRRVQTTGTSADPHGLLVQPTGTIAEAIWIRSGPIWVRWCNLRGRRQTHM